MEGTDRDDGPQSFEVPDERALRLGLLRLLRVAPYSVTPFFREFPGWRPLSFYLLRPTAAFSPQTVL